jgi:hypothetical protein
MYSIPKYVPVGHDSTAVKWIEIGEEKKRGVGERSKARRGEV